MSDATSVTLFLDTSAEVRVKGSATDVRSRLAVEDAWVKFDLADDTSEATSPGSIWIRPASVHAVLVD